MANRYVIALGLSMSGKSWFLNKVLEKKTFADGKVTSSVETRTKDIIDTINGVRYELRMLDTPGLNSKKAPRRQVLEDILDAMRGKKFYQIVVVLSMVQGLDQAATNYLRILGLFFKEFIEQSPESFTVVINQITKSFKDEDIIHFRDKVKSLLGLKSNECICIYSGETPRESTFRYLVVTDEGRNEFQDRKFLQVVGASRPLDLALLKKPDEIFAELSNDHQEERDPYSELVRKIKTTASNCCSDFLFRFTMVMSILLTNFLISFNVGLGFYEAVFISFFGLFLIVLFSCRGRLSMPGGFLTKLKEKETKRSREQKLSRELCDFLDASD